jgi:hypothetical protein
MFIPSSATIGNDSSIDSFSSEFYFDLSYSEQNRILVKKNGGKKLQISPKLDFSEKKQSRFWKVCKN